MRPRGPAIVIPDMRSVLIEIPASPSRSYEVLIGRGLLGELGERGALLLPRSSKRAFLIGDAGLPRALVECAAESLADAGFAVSSASIGAREDEKVLDTAARLLLQLASSRHERGDPVVALGGGITGDVAGFVAAVYRRGVPVIQCPTTLLSMADASVGGKTGVNLEADGSLRKNLVGAFHQPALVLIDTAALDSLPDRQLRSGLAECFKHGLIGHAVDPGLFEWTGRRLPAVLARDADTLAELIERNVRVKASFVSGDEREEKLPHEAGRMILNLGHTFAHAIETIPTLSPTSNPADAPLHHGEAVALGIVASCFTSASMGRLDPAAADRIRRTLADAGLPARIAGLPSDEDILAAMSHDKKSADGWVRVVLPVSIGRAVVVENPPEDAVREGIRAIRG